MQIMLKRSWKSEGSRQDHVEFMLAVPKVMPAAIKPPASRDDISTEHAVDLISLTNIVEIRD